MLLHSRSIVFEVCLVLIASQGVYVSAKTSKAKDPYDYGYDYTKYFGDEAKAEASDSIANRGNPKGSFESRFVYPVEYESFYFAPSRDPNVKESKTSKSFAQHPSEAETDPYEELRRTFEENDRRTAHEAEAASSALIKDYYEESQKKLPTEQAEESEIRPGPHYVSHQIPVPEHYNADGEEEDEAQSKDDVETVRPPLKGKSSKKPKKTSPGQSDFDGYQDKYDSSENAEEQTKEDPATYYGAKNPNYNSGKSSSKESQRPAASYSNFPATTQTPYNYEALQSKYLESLAPNSADGPSKNVESAALNAPEKDDGSAAPSETVAENLQKKGCRKIHGPDNAENMNCFVCENAGTKAKYTQCSYASGDEPVNQYAGSSVRYSSPVKAPANFRQKRSPGGDKYSDDPYFTISERNRKYFEDFEREQQAAESERQKDFHYKPYGPEEDEGYSASQSAELLKQPGACEKVDREGSTCTVCKDPKTGGNFEQCSYTSAPKEHKYAYVAEKKYDSEDQPEESKIELKHSPPSEDPQNESSSQVSQSAVAPAEQFSTATKSKIIKDPIPELAAAGTTIDETKERVETEEDDPEAEDDEEPESSQKQKESDYGPYYFNYGELKKDKKLVGDDPYDVPEHFAASVSQEKNADDEDEENFDEYHYKLFPELSKEAAESRNEEQRTDATEQKPHDVEEVLAEFAKKDRSKCQKAEKNGMTCFLCVDQNKVQHEECMYIAESKPRPTHIAYHEVQRLKDPKDENHPLVNEPTDTEESKKIETKQPLDALPSASETTKKKRFFKKVITSTQPLDTLELSGAASDVHKTVVPYEKKTKGYRRETVKDSRAAGSAPDSERVEDDQKQKSTVEEPETPKEIDVGDEEGAFSEETKPVYSKLFGTTLPKYMVEKTEFEKDFDSVAGFD